MRHLAQIKDAVKERYDRLDATNAAAIDDKVKVARNWINATPELLAILAEAERVEPNLNYKTWRRSTEQYQQLTWPSSTEAGCAVLAWSLMNDLANRIEAGEKNQIYLYSMIFAGQPDRQIKVFVREVLRPLFDYLSDQVAVRSAVLHVLQRYVARVQMFDYRELHDRYVKAKIGEDIYDTDLQRFLFLDAGYITYAKARVARGEPDLVGRLDTDDPLICEGKLYDGKRGTSYLDSGLNQVWLAAKKYNKTVAYLVVFNLTTDVLQFPTDGPAGAWAPYIERDNIRIHIIVVRALPPDVTDSEAGRAKIVAISRADLFTTADQADQGIVGDDDGR